MANLSWFGSATGTNIDGAIVGANPNPFKSSWIPSGQSAYLSSGALNAGEPGELGGLTDATIEFWFSYSGLPAALRTLVIGPESAAATRQWGFELNTTGTVRFYVRNVANTAILVTSTTALQTGFSASPTDLWYHIVGVADSAGALVRLYINGTQEASTAWAAGSKINASSLSATAGDLRVGDPTAGINLAFDELVTYRRFIGANRISAHYTAGTARGFAVASADKRIGDVLDNSASVHAPRSLKAGVNVRSVTASYMSAQAPLAELQKARAADNVDAMLFISKSGVVTFLGDGHRGSSPYDTVQATFGDAGGSELAYVDLTLDYSDAFLINEWNVTREQGRKSGSDIGASQTNSDATSISRYFRRPQSLSDVPVTLDSDAATISTELLAKTKDPMLRVTSIALSTADPNVADAALALELGDRIRVLRTPPGGGARIDQTLFVQKIEVSGANDGQAWSIRFGVSPL